ncbi:hypothetical protein [Aeromonas sp. FDAARGOS 1407]|uniref:hypothetical protein n=1 Tax=Aeromonas TaxID=642 RepID=UPI001C22EEDA|nr:hypothetical protein [Aeromonas sp. FDAARGOS 1407]QXC33429.1 hypothetical protein I6L37_17955 [Aeromonas sp. FDAARGOS 1407]
MNKAQIPRLPSGEIDVFRLKMRDPVRVDYAAYDATPSELAEMVLAVANIQRQLHEQPLEVAA